MSGRDTELTRLRFVRSKPIPFPPEPVRSVGINLTRWSLARADAHRGEAQPLAARPRLGGAGLRLLSAALRTCMHINVDRYSPHGGVPVHNHGALQSYRRNGMIIFVLLLYSGYALGKVAARFRSSTIPQ